MPSLPAVLFVDFGDEFSERGDVEEDDEDDDVEFDVAAVVVV
jgi:hypothetical protein